MSPLPAPPPISAYPNGIDALVAMIASGRCTVEEADHVWRKLLGEQPERTPSGFWMLLNVLLTDVRREHGDPPSLPDIQLT